MLPPKRRGGVVEWTPGSGGGMPTTPRKGASSTERPCSSGPSRRVERPAERRSPSATSSRSYRPRRAAGAPDVDRVDREHVPGTHAAHLDRAARACPRRAPGAGRRRPAVERPSASPRSAPGRRRSRPARPRGRARGRGEKCPCSVRRSSGSSWTATRTPAAAPPRRPRARPTACTRPRSSSTGTERRSRSPAARARAGRGSPSRRGSPRARRRSPHVRGASCTMTTRPVFAAEASSASSSSGLSVRTSSTSTEARRRARRRPARERHHRPVGDERQVVALAGEPRPCRAGRRAPRPAPPRARVR